jgi:hypothetical protein
MNPPLKVAALLSSKMYDIDNLLSDPPVLQGLLSSAAYKAAAEAGTTLPDDWSVNVTVSVIVSSHFSDERVLRLEGVVIPI